MDTLDSIVQDVLRTLTKTEKDFDNADQVVKKNIASAMFDTLGVPKKTGFKIKWMNENFG